MAKRGGFPGGGMPGNMANLMKQAQRMQRQMEEQQKELETKEFTATAGGGAVEVTVTGKREVTKVKLAEEVVDPDDIDSLQMFLNGRRELLKRRKKNSKLRKYVLNRILIHPIKQVLILIMKNLVPVSSLTLREQGTTWS